MKNPLILLNIFLILLNPMFLAISLPEQNKIEANIKNTEQPLINEQVKAIQEVDKLIEELEDTKEIEVILNTLTILKSKIEDKIDEHEKEKERLEELKPFVYPYKPYSYEDLTNDTLKLSIQYPNVINTDVIGSTVEGRDIHLIKLGNGSNKILLIGGHHGNEYITGTFLMKMIDVYAYHYEKSISFGNYNVREILNKVTLYVVPSLNPDCTNIIQNGIEAAKDPNKLKQMLTAGLKIGEWKSNANGVDLNRNYPPYQLWKSRYTGVFKPARRYFKGVKPASEPEVQAIIKLCEQNNFLMAHSFHTKGNFFYWSDPKNHIETSLDLANKFSKLTGFPKVNYRITLSGGNFESWFRWKYKKPSFCIEITPDNKTEFPHDDSKFDEIAWENIKYTGLFFANEVINSQ